MANPPGEQNLRAKLNLFAVVPLLETLVELDPKAEKWAKRIKSPVTISVTVNKEMAVCVTGGENGLKVDRKFDKTGAVVKFPDVKSLNALFAGGKVLPKVSGILRQPMSVLALGFLIRRMAEVMTSKDTTPELRANLIINAIARSFEVLGNSDPSFFSVLGRNNAIIVWEINPSGPAAYVSIKEGNWRFSKGRISNYTVAIEFKNIEGFLDLIEGRDTARMAFFRGNIRPRGDAMLAMKIGFLMQEVQRYLNVPL